MALYSKEELAYERSKGLELSDYDNEHYYDVKSNNEWTIDEFEVWLSSKEWDEETKNEHRNRFEGRINFYEDGTFGY